MVVLSTMGAQLVDYLFRSGARENYATRAGLLAFFAVFYTIVQVVTFVAQTGVGASLRRLGLGRTISVLPAGLGASSILAIVFRAFPIYAFTRGVESVLRGSFSAAA
jgi:ATP/ADP translocase